MAKTERLFALLDNLRRRRRPVSADTLAIDLGVSVRTIYRDMVSLSALGVPVDGEGGIGYVLNSGFFLPPLMFDVTELEALTVGARYVEQLADKPLAAAATNALAKIASTSAAGIGAHPDAISLYVNPNEWTPAEASAMPVVRAAVRSGHKLDITYVTNESRSKRAIWPIAVAFYDQPMLAAWCELREDFRTFAVLRIEHASVRRDRVPGHRARLFDQYLSSVAAKDH